MIVECTVLVAPKENLNKTLGFCSSRRIEKSHKNDKVV